MSGGVGLEQVRAFSPEQAEAVLAEAPAAPGVFALRGESAEGQAMAEPYLSRTADVRRRLRRLLAPAELDGAGQPVLSRRLNLRERVRWVEWTRTGSEFESSLLLYRASRAAFGAEEARRRLRLHPPYFLRVTLENRYPRVYVTNRLGRRSLAESFGPFASRAAAERYCDAVLDLFLLRRCWEDLNPYPEHPGCVYGEMNKCLRPCQEGAAGACSPEQYAAEAARVRAFLATRGESLLGELAARREEASEAMDFEAAAAVHAQWEKARAAALLGDELVRAVRDVRAVVVQESAPRGRSASQDGETTPEATVFLLQQGRIAGPERLSTLGVRAVREQTAVGSSLFAQPLMLAPVPEEQRPGARGPGDGGLGDGGLGASGVGADEPVPEGTVGAATLTPEARARGVLARLERETAGEVELSDLCDALALFRRWYFRPEKQRAGEVFLPAADGEWPVRRILNGAARVVLGPPAEAPAVDREAARTMKTKVLHKGREGVERVVPVLPRKSRA